LAAGHDLLWSASRHAFTVYLCSAAFTPHFASVSHHVPPLSGVWQLYLKSPHGCVCVDNTHPKYLNPSVYAVQPASASHRLRHFDHALCLPPVRLSCAVLPAAISFLYSSWNSEFRLTGAGAPQGHEHVRPCG